MFYKIFIIIIICFPVPLLTLLFYTFLYINYCIIPIRLLFLATDGSHAPNQISYNVTRGGGDCLGRFLIFPILVFLYSSLAVNR